MPPNAVTPAKQVDKSPQGEKGGSDQQNLFSKDERETRAQLEGMSQTNAQNGLPGRLGIAARSSYEQQGSATGNTAKLSETTTASDAALLLADQPAAESGAGSNLTTTVFSATGKLIDQLLQTTRQQGNAPALQGSKPILTAPPVSSSATPEIAGALKNTVMLSGLFYESHIGEVIQNQRSLSQLMLEPQAQQPATAEQTSTTSSPSSQTEPLNATISQLVAQQLNTLEQNRIVWQGEIWPGQLMYWAVQEDTTGQHNQAQTGEEASQQRVWRSDMQFSLPHLGNIQASVFYSNGRAQVRISAADEAAATALRAHAPQLAGALSDAGTQLDALNVQTDNGE
jgi:flagellar hook-length control protein FliK